jgi:hypothetical protein
MKRNGIMVIDTEEEGGRFFGAGDGSSGMKVIG